MSVCIRDCQWVYACLSAYMPAHLPACLPAYLPACLPACLSVYPPIYLPACLLPFLLTSLYLPACPSASLSPPLPLACISTFKVRTPQTNQKKVGYHTYKYTHLQVFPPAERKPALESHSCLSLSCPCVYALACMRLRKAPWRQLSGDRPRNTVVETRSVLRAVARNFQVIEPRAGVTYACVA